MPSDLIVPTAVSVPSQGIALNYWDYGNVQAPTIALIHGIRDHGRSWDWVASELAADFHVVAIDLRGHGDSDWSAEGAYLLPYHLQDFVAVADALGEAPMHVVGHSFGGNVASRFAALYPERTDRLVIVDGFGPSRKVYAGWDAHGPVNRTRDWLDDRRAARTKPAKRFATQEEGIARMAAGNERLSPEQARHLAIEGMRAHPDGYGWKFDPQVSMFAPEDFAVRITEFWAHVQVPTLLLYGADSWNENPDVDGRSEALADRKSVPIPAAGHWPHHDQLAFFVEQVRGFVGG